MRIASISALAGFLGLALATPAVAAPARIFLTNAIQGDTAEVRLGTLVQQRARDSRIRDFGTMLVQDHSRSREAAIAAARQEHLAIPAGVKPDARAEMAKLRRLSGRAFDREVIRHSIADHRKDIAKFDAQARNGDRITRAHAQATLPHLRHHLDMALSLR